MVMKRAGAMEEKPARSPLLAGVLSGLLPGLGQFYNRQWAKGVGFLLLSFFIVTALASVYDPLEAQRAALRGKQPSNLELLMTLAMLLLGLAVWSIVDAVRHAKDPRSSRMAGY